METIVKILSSLVSRLQLLEIYRHQQPQSAQLRMPNCLNIRKFKNGKKGIKCVQSEFKFVKMSQMRRKQFSSVSCQTMSW